MNDNPAACRATWLASEIIPASATTVTSDSWWAALKALITGSIVAVSALLPSNASTVSGNPAASVSSPRVICGSRRLSLELCRRRHNSNYAEAAVMPSSWWLWWCSCCSAGLAGVTCSA